MNLFNKNKSSEYDLGQSTIEFTLTLILLFAYVLFYFQLCMIFAFGNYTHYATFMSARAYLSSRMDRADQVSRAQEVLVGMLKLSSSQPRRDRFPIFAKGFDKNSGSSLGGSDIPGLEIDPPSMYSPTDKDFSWLQGVRYTFKSRLFLLSFGSSARQINSPVNTITLTSESWLGRETAYDECQNQMNGLVFDNGC